MSVIRSADLDFRICQIDLETLLDIQRHAEGRGWGTRWSSQDALRRQVGADRILLQPILREEWSGAIRAYRCFVLFSAADGPTAGGVATIDVSPETYATLPRIDRDPDVRSVLARVFTLASGGIAMLSKG